MSNTVPTYLLSDLASRVGGRLLGDANLSVSSLNTLDASEPSQLSFLANKKYVSRLATTRATAVLVAEEYAKNLPCAAIIVSDPYLAFAQLTKLFDWRAPCSPYIDQSASISMSSSISTDVYISPGVVIGDNVVVESGVYIGANSVIGNNCVIARNTRLEAGVVLYDNVQIGEGCLIHSSVILGGDGFGFAPAKEGWVKIHQLGGVRIGRDVEIGAGTTIDRGALDHTYIHDGVKLDNQIQIAHNVVIGEQTAIAGCTAIAGSTRIGSRCTIAGLSGIVGHLTIADNTHVTAMTLISKSVTEPGQVLSSGTGQELHRDWKKNVVRFKQLNQMAKRITTLEQQVKNFSSEG
ncbi:UDP-3-O-(3-hydroxymyristoyl)glucosamine N-acyltransferase [Neptunomonas qingdaonensis]|uniref:UDP-3-O-acylglucosamine N-acyltransferase n=1 Tax=Neptunomonas qingdaonensis TaxID=1045558 RepID=A0A1I2N913_9GAMM|nr:UDP-3-O-(3-hydroxymyristoyl)glucosamine N-acyltransferase [Neptunomonas qingdaonensis]SFF99610.1 UDP-3-O-[3-hydroxymyristoyl] glucosamine N-acyltransferase [Neptunomonas qingdaonensis]